MVNWLLLAILDLFYALYALHILCVLCCSLLFHIISAVYNICCKKDFIINLTSSLTVQIE